MKNSLRENLLALSLRMPLRHRLSSTRPICLLYHGVPQINLKPPEISLNSETFEEHIIFIKKHFQVIFPRDIMHRRHASDKVQVLLTFDDGFQNNATVVAPILRQYKVPAIFFACTRHITPGNYLWFNHLSILEEKFPHRGFCFYGVFMDMSPERRSDTITRLQEHLLSLRPHPAAMYAAMEHLPHPEEFLTGQEILDWCAGMTREQIAELDADPLFTVEVHCHDHPFLTKCDPDEQARQVKENQRLLGDICGRKSAVISYPLGDYNDAVLRLCQQAGFTQGFAVNSNRLNGLHMEIPRVGVSKPSVKILAFKILWGNYLRALSLKVG
jgi:peptidoglycan/xylan/chitin deacetylase (PgdA/CDA1 family)